MNTEPIVADVRSGADQQMSTGLLSERVEQLQMEQWVLLLEGYSAVLVQGRLPRNEIVLLILAATDEQDESSSSSASLPEDQTASRLTALSPDAYQQSSPNVVGLLSDPISVDVRAADELERM